MEDCWRHDPSQRPTFSEIIPRLSDVMSECARLEHLEVICNNISEPSARQFWVDHFLKEVRSHSLSSLASTYRSISSFFYTLRLS
jgi:hypothetical protein